MKINLGVLIDSLSAKISLDILASNWFDIEIDSLRVLKRGNTQLLPNILYIADCKLIGDLNVSCPANLLCYNSTVMNLNLNQRPGNINLFLANGTISEYTLLNAVLSCITSLPPKNFPASLAEELLQCRDLNLFCETVSGYIGNPVLITNADGQMIACTKGMITRDGSWNEAGYLFFGSPNSEQEKLWTRFLIQSDCNGRAVYREIMNKRILLCPLISCGTIIGFICIPEYESMMGELDLERTELIRSLLMQSLGNFRGSNLSFRNPREYFLGFLLSGSEIPPVRLLIMQESMGVTFAEELFYCVVIRFNRAEGSYQLFSEIRKLLPKEYVVNSVYYNYDIVLLIGVSRPMENPREGLVSLLEALEGNDVSIGLSLPFHQLNDTNQCYQQALGALKYGMQFAPGQMLHTYDQNVVYYLLEDYPDQERIQDLCHPGILHLRELDQINGTSYLDTFRCYILSGRSLRRTAEELFIHRNTVSYHVSKCLDKLNVDLNDGNQLFQVTLSLKIVDYLYRRDFFRNRITYKKYGKDEKE